MAEGLKHTLNFSFSLSDQYTPEDLVLLRELFAKLSTLEFPPRGTLRATCSDGENWHIWVESTVKRSLT